MNHVVAPVGGVVTAILVENGASVEYGQPIVVDRPGGLSDAMPPLERVLVANRGEIAVRIIRACFDEGIESVLAVSEADRGSLGAQLADRTVVHRPGQRRRELPRREPRGGRGHGRPAATALHPGYGFLSERPELSAACDEAGIAFVGPSADGDARAAATRRPPAPLAASSASPIDEGSDVVDTEEEARAVAERVGYPVLLKAAGGRRRARHAPGRAGRGRWRAPGRQAARRGAAGRSATAASSSSASCAAPATSRSRCWRPATAASIHLGHRDCTLQRRYQKLIEEAPALGLSEPLEREILGAATHADRRARLPRRRHLRVPRRPRARQLPASSRSTPGCRSSTRSREMVTGVDVVREQLRIAGGDGALGHPGRGRGRAATRSRCGSTPSRPERGFAPTPGRLERWAAPVGTDVRVDTACFPGWTITPHYDSLLAKVIARGDDREDALERTAPRARPPAGRGRRDHRAASRVDLLEHPDVVAGEIHTRWLEDVFLPSWTPTEVAA